MIIAGTLAVLALVLVAPSLGVKVTGGIECAIQRVLGGECAPDASDEPCPISNSTSTDSLSADVSIKLVSLGGGIERAVIKETFDDGTAVYTVIDRATLEAALGDTTAGGGVRFGGSQGSLTAGLGAFGALEDAEIYETDSAEQTEAIDEKLADPGFAENLIRSYGSLQDSVLDAPVDGVCALIGLVTDCPDARPSDALPNPTNFIADQVFGDQDLPEPDSEYVGGEFGAHGLAEFISDRGGLPNAELDELGAEVELIQAGGVRTFTDGDREGETELYYRIEGSVSGELEDAFLGTLGGSADGEITATVVMGADGVPATLRLNATGTLTGEEDLGADGTVLSGGDLSETLADTDTDEGKTYEVVAELDLSDPDNLLRAAQLLSVDPATKADGLDGLVDAYRDDAEVRFATYDTSRETTSSGVDIFVAGIEGESSEEANTLESLYVKPPGSTGFEKTRCGTDGAG